MSLQPDLLHLSESARHTISLATLRSRPHEACGILVGYTNHVQRAVNVQNRAEAPEHDFRIAPSDLVQTSKAASRDGCDVIGFFHSHPNGSMRPSAPDIRAAAPWDGYLHIISAPVGDNVLLRAWRTAPQSWRPVTIG